jgi:adenine deaminase
MLLPLVNAYTSAVLGLCSDDRNPADMAVEGHINAIIQRGLALGKRPEDLFRVASFAAARAYGLNDRGVIAPGFLGDLCVVAPHNADAWEHGFTMREVIKSGQLITSAGLEEMHRVNRQEGAAQEYFTLGNNLAISTRSAADFSLRVAPATGVKEVDVAVIEVIKNQILTEKLSLTLPVIEGEILLEGGQDIAKIAVIERHRGTERSATALVKGFNLRQGAIASTIAHDCHNIIVVGADGEAMADAVNYLKKIDGGIVVWKNADEHAHLALPLGGLMSEEGAEEIAKKLNHLITLTKSMGCDLDQPFLQLSFLALPVIGKLKISDRGLIDVTRFCVIEMIEAVR